MPISQDDRFAFDVSGYLHLRGALSAAQVAEYTRWMSDVDKIDVKAFNHDRLPLLDKHLNRPVSRVIDADPRFACFLDHPVSAPYLTEFLGADYRHIDNDLYYTHPGYKGGGWHRGVRARSNGHVSNGKFVCPMVKVFYCMTDVGPGDGEFTVIPGSHRAAFEIEMKDRVDVPAQHIFNDVRAGDVIIFNEALLHNGRPNLSQKTRKTIIVNFGRREAGVWEGYTPAEETLKRVTPRQREILTNLTPSFWKEPELCAAE
jgi:hypothetical protein